MSNVNYLRVEPNSDFKYIKEGSITVKRETKPSLGYTIRMTPMVGDEIRVCLTKQQIRDLMVNVLGQDALAEQPNE